MSYSKIIAVTGAARGIGFEIVNQLSVNPLFQVLALVRDVGSALALRELGRSNVFIVGFDISSVESVTAGAEEVMKISGGKLDVLINNAGVHPGNTKLIDETLDVLTTTTRINVFGGVIATQALLPYLRARETKIIVNLTSGLGSNGFILSDENFFPSTGAYNFSKGANVLVNTLLAFELRSEGFTALAWHPGWVDTDMGNFIKLPGMAPPVSPSQSAKSLIEVVHGLSTKDNGKFLGVADAEGTIFTVPY